MPLRLFAFTPPPHHLYSSLCKRLLMDRNQSQPVALLTRASHSSAVLMSSSLAGEMQTGAITAQDEAYFPRKKNKPSSYT